MKALIHVLACAALATAGGCASGDLMIDAMLTDELHCVVYHLEPIGRLTVTLGGGALEGAREAPVYTTRVDEAGMARLKQVVADSGFLLAGTPIRGALAGGPALRLEVKLGLWHNVVRLHGTRMESAAKIIDEMNRHLPARYALDYNPPPRKEERLDDLFR